MLITRACSVEEGIACDGFVLMREKGKDWTWDFYNRDGSEAEMCGNAARCAMLFLRDVLGFPIEHVVLHTKSGQVLGRGLGDGSRKNEFEITMTHGFQVLKEITLAAGGKQNMFTLLDTGVPHLVFNGMALSLPESKKLRMNFEISPVGANVTSYMEQGTDHIRAVSYERGVEDFTQACGTGAVAAALDYWRKSSKPQNERWVKVDMPGGRLEVFCTQKGKPKMRGPAVILLKAKINKEYLS